MADSPIATEAPPPTNSSPPEVAGPFNDAFNDLDKMVGASAQAPSRSPGAKEATRRSEAQAKAAKPSEEPVRPGNEPLEEAPSTESKPAEVKSPAELETPVAKPVEAKPKQGPWQMLREAQAKLKEMESKVSAKPDEASAKAVEEKLSKLEADLAEKEKAIQLADYTQSEDYAKNFHKPFVNAYTEAREAVAQFQVTDLESGETRQATGDDFDALMRVNDPNKAAEMIDIMFGTGTKAGEVAAMRRDILKLNQKLIAQIESKKAESSATRAQTEAQRTKAQQEATKAYTETLEKLTTERKEFFAPDDDAKGNEILAKSRAIADMAFGRLPEGRAPLTPAEAAKLHAVIHAKASGFDRVVYRHQQAQAKIKALEIELAEFRQSEPGKGEGKTGKAPTKNLSPYEAAEAALEAMAR